jgi:hypothetical protein
MRGVAPRTVSIACQCGATGEAPVGALVECECGHSFEAAAPASHDADLCALQRRHRVLLALSLLVVLALCAAPLLVVDRGAALLVPIAAVAVWLTTVRPHLDRLHRRRLASLPGWSLSA